MMTAQHTHTPHIHAHSRADTTMVEMGVKYSYDLMLQINNKMLVYIHFSFRSAQTQNRVLFGTEIISIF